MKILVLRYQKDAESILYLYISKKKTSMYINYDPYIS
jgi:hypothetical protein